MLLGYLLCQVNEIDKSIDAAEKNPQRFKLSQQELSDRRKWVMSIRRQIEGITGGLVAAANGGGGIAAPSSAASKLEAAAHEDNERFIQSEGDRQQLLMRWVALTSQAGACEMLGNVSCNTRSHSRSVRIQDIDVGNTGVVCS